MRKILTVIFTVAFLSASAQAPAGQTVDIESDISGIVYGNSTTTKLGFSKGNSNNTDPNGNIVNTNGHRVSGSIYGGKFRTSNNDDNVNGNTVNISGESGEFGDWIYGGYAMLGEACNNTLNISGGKFTYWVVGSYSLDGKAAGNTVNIIGGSFDSIIYGGYSISGETATG